MIIFFSNIEIDLNSFYTKNLIAKPKIRRKIDRSPYSFTLKQQFISLVAKLHRKEAAILFLCARSLCIKLCAVRMCNAIPGNVKAHKLIIHY